MSSNIGKRPFLRQGLQWLYRKKGMKGDCPYYVYKRGTVMKHRSLIIKYDVETPPNASNGKNFILTWTKRVTLGR